MKKKKKKWSGILGKIFLAIVLISAIAGIIGYLYATKKYNGEKTRIYVDAPNGPEALRDSLTTRLGNEYGERVYKLLGIMADRDSLSSGSYVVEPGEKAWKLAGRIKNRRQNPLNVRFNNIRTYGQLMARLDRQLLADSISLAGATDSILGSRGVKKANYAAHFLPDTYEFYWTEPASGVIDKITSHYDNFWNEERIKKAKTLGLTPEQVSTIASIVEEETNKADERPKVARLYLNRLKKNMKLQADPTVKFAVGDFSLRRILGKHLQVNSPYNTYKYVGLPPGPIRLPEAATLDAVLNAPTHDYIYMCAKEDFSGYHNFAADYETHKANARRYQAELNKRGI